MLAYGLEIRLLPDWLERRGSVLEQLSVVVMRVLVDYLHD